MKLSHAVLFAIDADVASAADNAVVVSTFSLPIPHTPNTAYPGRTRRSSSSSIGSNWSISRLFLQCLSPELYREVAVSLQICCISPLHRLTTNVHTSYIVTNRHNRTIAFAGSMERAR